MVGSMVGLEMDDWEGKDPLEGNNWGDRGTGECLRKVESARLIQLCLCIAMARWCR